MEKTKQKSLSWEKFEEHAKAAYAAQPHDTRFFLKTRLSAKKKPTKLVARVTAVNKSIAPATPKQQQQSIKYQTQDALHVTRIARLLRFGVQEILGPMKTTSGAAFVFSPPSTPTAAAKNTTATAPSAPAQSAANNSSKKKTKKKGKK